MWVMFVRAFGVWLIMLVIAISNGIVRVAWLEPLFGAPTAHLTSTALLCTVFAVLIWLLLPWVVACPGGKRAAKQATEKQGAKKSVPTLYLWLLGAFWLLLTVAFEFIAGHYLFGHPWERLVHDYNILEGRVWIAVLAVLLIAPVGLARLRDDFKCKERTLPIPKG